jgi:hypothetical protein
MVLRGKLRGRVGSRRDYLTRARESISSRGLFRVLPRASGVKCIAAHISKTGVF